MKSADPFTDDGHDGHDGHGGGGDGGRTTTMMLSHPNPAAPLLHHVTLTAKPHAFAGAVLTPKHARELTPALVLSVVVSLAEQASATKGSGGGVAGSSGGGGGGSASVTGTSSLPGGGHAATLSGASSVTGYGHGGVPQPPPSPSPSLPHSPPSLGRKPVGAPGVANADAAFRTIQPTASMDSGVGGGGAGSGGGAATGVAQMPLSPSAVAAKYCKFVLVFWDSCGIVSSFWAPET